MRLAHLADVHLGWRQFERADPSGCNLREADVERAFAAAVTQIIAAKPDLCVIAGDLFHSVRPTNRAILAAFREVSRLRAAGIEVVVVAGNHDTPRSLETGRILPLLEQAGAHVVPGELQRFELVGHVVTCVSSWALENGGELPGPIAGARNILVLHGDLIGYPTASGKFAAVGRLEPEALAGWDYVALGDYHSVAEIRPGMWYSGSVEYTSSNVWADLAAGPKVWLEVNLGSGAPQIKTHPIPTRRHLDIPPFDATGLGAAEIDARLRERFAEFPIEDAVARLRVLNIPRDVQRHLDFTQIRKWKAAAVNLNLALRRPEAETIGTPASRARMHESIDERMQRFLDDRELPPDLSRPDLKQLAAHYLDQARQAQAEKEPG